MSTDKIIDSLTHTLWDTDMVVTRLMMGVAEFWWGLLLIWPGMTFGRPTYSHMAAVMPEEAWALVFFASSATQITIVTAGQRAFVRNGVIEGAAPALTLETIEV